VTELPSYRKILVATDGSDTADLAVLHAISLARQTGATLVATAVVDTHAAFGAGIHRDDVVREELADARRAVERVEGLAREHGVAVLADVAEGRTGDTIVELAAEHDADLIFVGSHGQGNLADVILGSVSQHVLRHARAPVCIVRPAHSA